MLVILTILVTAVCSKTLNDLMYTSINFDDILCFRMNNYNSQTGCQTNRDGDNGILYPFESDEILLETLETSLSSPIIAVINASLFTNKTVEQLINYPLTKGLIVMEETVTTAESFSPEKTCPGNGFNYNETAVDIEKKECLSKRLWNPDGNWLSYFDIPFGIFIIKNESQMEIINNKATANIIDGSLKNYPLWGGEMKAFMNSALDTSTCMRRGTCDPIGGLNMIVNLVPRLEGKNKSIVLFVVKADATAFFKDLSYGGEASGGSIVALLGVIKSLSQVRDNDPTNNFDSVLSSEFMVTFLQAESFDYSGSQRLAYNLKNGKFGRDVYNVSLDDVKCIIELGPLSLSNEIYLQALKYDSTVNKIQELFLEYNKNPGASEIYFVNSTGDLPPSSLNSFLREDDTVSGVLLTDSGSKLLSHVYGSRFDIIDTPLSNLAVRIKSLVGIIANVSLQLAGGSPSVYTEIEETLVNDLLVCILVNQNCSLLQGLLNKTDLENKRLSRYASVGYQPSNCTIYLNQLASDFSKIEMNLTKDYCNSTYGNGWNVVFINGTCYGTIVNLTSAKSPAFVLKQYNSSLYSTWTESRWSPSFMLRVFQVASQSGNITLFCCGLLYFIVVSAFIFQCHRRKDLIFPSD